MNSNIFRALFRDSFQQVIDNKIFRLLVILVLVMIGLTFLIQIREEGISFLWLTEYSYSDLTASFGLPIPEDFKPGEAIIKNLQALFVEWFAGVAGIVFCVAATAFFVPRMLEKGAADTLFSKPISRTTLLLMRYFSGLLFVGVLSFTLVIGMYSGFAISSGYSDTNFLWSAVTLIYLYAMLQAFSVLVGTVTRSSVAAMLAVLTLFPVSSCTHFVWRQKEWAQTQQWLSDMQTLSLDRLDEEGDAELSEQEEELEGVLYLLDTSFNSFHYILPKTSDASQLTSMLRGAVEGLGPALRDDEGQILVEFSEHPGGMTRVGPAEPDFKDPVLWVSEESNADERMRVSLRRRDRSPKVAPGERPKRLHHLREANTLLDELEEKHSRGEVLGHPLKETRLGEQEQIIAIRWEGGSQFDSLREARLFFQVPEWLYEITLTVPESAMDDAAYDHWETEFLRGLHLGARLVAPDDWYKEQFDWDSEWRYNAFFSIGTSLAFALLCLMFSAYRLNRYDF